MVFQPYRDLEAGDKVPFSENSSGEAGNRNPGPLAPQAESLTTRTPLLPVLSPLVGIIFMGIPIAYDIASKIHVNKKA